MQTLIVVPAVVQKPGQYYEFPLGLSYVAACLKAAGFSVHCLNLNHEKEPAELVVARTVRDKDIDVVCTGGLSVHYHAVKQVLAAARQAKPDVLTIGGGGLVSSEPELMVASLPLDIGVVGEGEETCVEVLTALANNGNLADVPAICWRGPDGRILRGPDRESPVDMDSLPLPDMEAFGLDFYLDMQRTSDSYYLAGAPTQRMLPVISSRSCPFNCTFCYHPLGKRYRRRSLDSFFAEVEYWVSAHGISGLAILDELFPTDPAFLEAFCERMAPLELRWVAQLRVSDMSRAKLRMLRDAGLCYISYGIESASPLILKSMRKKVKVRDVENALRLTREESIGIQGNLLFGDPAETPETARESLDWFSLHPQYHLNLNFVVPYPGSAIYQGALERGIIRDRLEYIRGGCPPVNLTRMDQDQLHALGEAMAAVKAGARVYSPSVRAERAGFDALKDEQVWTVTAQCPHCGETSRYERFVAPDFALCALSCAACNQRFDCPPTAFSHHAERAAKLGNAVREMAGKGPLLAAPCLFVATMHELMGLLGLAPDDLEIEAYLDPRQEKWGRTGWGGAPVLPLDVVGGAVGKGRKIFVIPCHERQAIARELLARGVDEADLLRLDAD